MIFIHVGEKKKTIKTVSFKMCMGMKQLCVNSKDLLVSRGDKFIRSPVEGFWSIASNFQVSMEKSVVIYKIHFLNSLINWLLIIYEVQSNTAFFLLS